ncbi:MAG: L,D-transpeptidase family protein [Patescibacteria group bacterium]
MEFGTNTKTKNKVGRKILLALLLSLITLMVTGGLLNLKAKDNTLRLVNELQTNHSKLESLDSKSIVEFNNQITSIKDRSDKAFFFWDYEKIYKDINKISSLSKDQYHEELKSVRTEFLQSLEAWKTGLEQDKDFVGKNEILKELEALKEGVDKVQNSSDLKIQKDIFTRIQFKYKDQLDLYNKKALVDGLKAGQGDVNNLIEYLKKYPELSQSLSDVERYQSEINNLSQDSELKLFTFQELEDKLNNLIRPLLSDALDAKQKNEEKIRLAQSQNQTNSSQAPNTVGKSILVSKSKQRMFVYEDGSLIRESPITTGRTNWPTDAGRYSILTKERNRRLIGSGQGATWNVFVKYWMLFNASEEEGIHDAAWRNGNFGGPDYVSNGSRGCVNTPDETMSWLFNWANIGTTVVIED